MKGLRRLLARGSSPENTWLAPEIRLLPLASSSPRRREDTCHASRPAAPASLNSKHTDQPSPAGLVQPRIVGRLRTLRILNSLEGVLAAYRLLQ
jgi:hypothetical protein